MTTGYLIRCSDFKKWKSSNFDLEGHFLIFLTHLSLQFLVTVYELNLLQFLPHFSQIFITRLEFIKPKSKRKMLSMVRQSFKWQRTLKDENRVISKVEKQSQRTAYTCLRSYLYYFTKKTTCRKVLEVPCSPYLKKLLKGFAKKANKTSFYNVAGSDRYSSQTWQLTDYNKLCSYDSYISQLQWLTKFIEKFSSTLSCNAQNFFCWNTKLKISRLL